MSKSNYYELLKHPLWQRRRLEIMQRDEFACSVCYNSESMLHVHHKRYIKGRKPWEYDDHELITVCANCHEQIHATKAAIDEILPYFDHDGPNNIAVMIALILGYSEGKVPAKIFFNDKVDFTSHLEYHLGELCSFLVYGLGHQFALRLKKADLTKADINSLVAFFVANYSRLPVPKSLPYPEAGFIEGQGNEQ